MEDRPNYPRVKFWLEWRRWQIGFELFADTEAGKLLLITVLPLSFCIRLSK